MAGNLERYSQAFQTALGASEAELGEGYSFAAIDQWDSVAHLTLITELEDAFDVMFEPDDIIHFGSYLNGIEILKRYGVSFED